MSKFTDKERPCPFCGGGKFTAGTLREQGAVRFQANSRGLGDQLLGVGKADVKARICLNCRHIDLFAPEFEAA